MTKREALERMQQENGLMSLGFTREEADALRRISMTLHRWSEKECGDGNGCIERDEQTDKPYWYNSYSGRRYPIADREKGALRRLTAIVSARNQRIIAATHEPATIEGCLTNALDLSVTAYVQGDPRGCALYIIRPNDVPDGQDVDSYYTRGLAVA